MGALIWVHHEGNTLLHTTSVLIFGNLVEDGVANVYLCVVDDNFNHSLLFFFVKLVLSCDNTLDDHVYKLSIGRSHCSDDDLSLLLLLLHVPKHVLSSFGEHLSLFSSDSFLFSRFCFSSHFFAFLTLYGWALIAPLATLLCSEGSSPLVLTAAFKNEMGLIGLVVSHFSLRHQPRLA
jgi:hypothetical protein